MTEAEWLACEDPIQMLLFRFPSRTELFRVRFEGERSRRHIRRLAERAKDSDRKYHDLLLAMISPNGRVISHKRRCEFVRCILGNPFHPITLSPSWLTSTVVSLANQMYDTRDFSAMPILADALMDASCDNETILTHCRGPGPHTRGCWVLDLLTGRE